MKERQQANRSHSLKSIGPENLSASQVDQNLGCTLWPSEYRRAINLLTRETLGFFLS